MYTMSQPARLERNKGYVKGCNLWKGRYWKVYDYV